VTLYFLDHTGPGQSLSPARGRDPSENRVFNVFCNRKTVVPNLNIFQEAGENRPLVHKIKGLEPNAQGKLLLELAPVTRYATVTAIEVMPE
jgi:Malectin domain